MPKEPKDRWDKAGILLEPIGGSLTAVAVAVVGLVVSKELAVQQDTETNSRAYVELMSRREEAESALRKDMFASIIDSFLRPEAGGRARSMEEEVLNLELLAYNFHESLQLKPLFEHVLRGLPEEDGESGGEPFRGRLERVAREVAARQAAILETEGARRDVSIRLDKAPTSESQEAYECPELDPVLLNGSPIDLRLTVLAADPRAKSLRIRLEVQPREEGEGKSAKFLLDFFNFPMIDNLRFSRDRRCAVVLKNWGVESAELTVVCFAGSRASLRDKTFYEDVIAALRPR